MIINNNKCKNFAPLKEVDTTTTLYKGSTKPPHPPSYRVQRNHLSDTLRFTQQQYLVHQRVLSTTPIIVSYFSNVCTWFILKIKFFYCVQSHLCTRCDFKIYFTPRTFLPTSYISSAFYARIRSWLYILLKKK